MIPGVPSPPRGRLAVAGLLLVAAVVVVAVVAVFAWRQRAPVVEVVTLRPAPLVSTLQLSARVAAPNRVELGSTITGRVRSVAVREGDAVAAGQPLLQLEADELAATLAQAQAAERSAGARLQGLRSSGRGALQAGLAQAEAVLAAARADLARQQALVAQGFVSPARLDEARRAVGVAEAQRDAARAQRQAGDDDGGTDIAQAEAQLAQARAATEAARRRLEQATLRAPAAGRVVDRQAEPGQIVQPGRVLLTLAPTGDTELVAALDERYLGRLRPGQPAQVLADAYPDRRFAATVLRIAPLVDAQRGSVEIRLAPVPPVPDFLREDMTLSVEVETGRRAEALVLPLAALRGAGAGAGAGADEQRSTVWVVAADGRLAARSVALGLRTLTGAEALQGLQAGDLVVVAGEARPGDRVRTRPAEADRPAPAGGDARRGDGAGEAGAALGNAMGR